jgi:hypothetical protein
MSGCANFLDIHRLSLACRNLPHVHAQPEGPNGRSATFGLMKITRFLYETDMCNQAIRAKRLSHSSADAATLLSGTNESFCQIFWLVGHEQRVVGQVLQARNSRGFGIMSPNRKAGTAAQRTRQRGAPFRLPDLV